MKNEKYLSGVEFLYRPVLRYLLLSQLLDSRRERWRTRKALSRLSGVEIIDGWEERGGRIEEEEKILTFRILFELFDHTKDGRLVFLAQILPPAHVHRGIVYPFSGGPLPREHLEQAGQVMPRFHLAVRERIRDQFGDPHCVLLYRTLALLAFGPPTFRPLHRERLLLVVRHPPSLLLVLENKLIKSIYLSIYLSIHPSFFSKLKVNRETNWHWKESREKKNIRSIFRASRSAGKRFTGREWLVVRVKDRADATLFETLDKIKRQDS